jgi:hypothetical protein
VTAVSLVAPAVRMLAFIAEAAPKTDVSGSYEATLTVLPVVALSAVSDCYEFNGVRYEALVADPRLGITPVQCVTDGTGKTTYELVACNWPTEDDDERRFQRTMDRVADRALALARQCDEAGREIVGQLYHRRPQ